MDRQVEEMKGPANSCLQAHIGGQPKTGPTERVIKTKKADGKTLPTAQKMTRQKKKR
jgi:hypothetical protein